MPVKSALQLINRFFMEDDFDSDTQFCLHWFEQYGWESGKFGEADTLQEQRELLLTVCQAIWCLAFCRRERSPA